MKKTLTTIALVILAIGANYFIDQPATNDAPATQRPATGAVATAFQQGRSDVILEDAGRIVKVLPDDNKGSRHQRFLVDMGTNTILIAHNIDLAPRVDNIREGTQIRFKGEYEFNDKGGVVHWTHHDPGGRHEGGYLEYQGQRYQ